MADAPLVIGFTLAHRTYVSDGRYAACDIGHEWHVSEVPATFRADVLMFLTDVLGPQHLELQIVDKGGNIIWGWKTPKDRPIESKEPFACHTVRFTNLLIRLPYFAQYRLLVLANGTEIFRTLIELKHVQAPTGPGQAAG